MAAYYYLVAQLPYLIYGQVPPMSSQAFKELVRPKLSRRDAAILELVSLDPQPPKAAEKGPSYQNTAPLSGSVFIDKWREWERTLRLNLARHRYLKARIEGNAPSDPPALPADAVVIAAKAAAATETPIEIEHQIDKARWDAIEVLRGSDYFSRNHIYAYLLKLMLLERYALFDAETGFAEYNALYASILESAQTGTSPAGEST